MIQTLFLSQPVYRIFSGPSSMLYNELILPIRFDTLEASWIPILIVLIGGKVGTRDGYDLMPTQVPSFSLVER